jgi:hypothetical protein
MKINEVTDRSLAHFRFDSKIMFYKGVISLTMRKMVPPSSQSNGKNKEFVLKRSEDNLTATRNSHVFTCKSLYRFWKKIYLSFY